MYPSGESIGVVLNQQEVVLAQFAYERALPRMRTQDELKVPVPNEEGLFVFDSFASHQLLSAVRVARDISDQNLWVAENKYLDRRHDHAEPEELQLLSIDKQSEAENVSQFSELYKNTEACLSESQDMLIDRGLASKLSE